MKSFLLAVPLAEVSSTVSVLAGFLLLLGSFLVFHDHFGFMSSSHLASALIASWFARYVYRTLMVTKILVLLMKSVTINVRKLIRIYYDLLGESCSALWLLCQTYLLASVKISVLTSQLFT